MSWAVNAPPQVASMRTVLAGLVAFTSRSYVEATQIHTPFIGAEETIVYPAFVIVLDTRRQMRILVYTDADTLDDEQLQALAMELSDQLPSRYRAGGIVVAADPDVSEIGEPSDSQNAGYGSAAVTAIEITCQIGLDPGA